MGYLVLSPEFLPYVSTVVNMIISFTPLLSYGSTVLSIRKKQSSQGFSIDICGTMLVASILRIFYYINEPFEVTLLRQCFVMVFIQTILLRVALKYRSNDAIHFETYHSNWGKLSERFMVLNTEAIEETFGNYNISNDFDEIQLDKKVLAIFVVFLKCLQINILLIISAVIQLIKDVVRLFDYHYLRPFHYWQWRKSIMYWKFLLGFVLCLAFVQFIFNDNEYLAIIFGSASFMIESSLPLPQLLLFQRVKSVENFKVILLLSWLGGDVTKISYLFYGTDNVGLIFIIAAFFQMSLNIVIAYQFFYYKFNPLNPNSDIQLNYLPVSVNDQSLSSYSNRPTETSTVNSIGSNRSMMNNDENVAVMISTTPSIPMSPKGKVQIQSHEQGVRTSMNRGPSLSLSGILPGGYKADIVPQYQHFQHHESLSQVNENESENEIDLLDNSFDSTQSNINTNRIDSNDGVDMADGVDISGIIPKLKNNVGNGVLNTVPRSRATSIDATHAFSVSSNDMKDSFGNIISEEVRTRINSLHASPGSRTG